MNIDEESAKMRARPTTGALVKEYRELQGMSQQALAEAAHLPQATISAIEHDRVPLGIVRAKRIGKALKVHPVVLLSPRFEE